MIALVVSPWEKTASGREKTNDPAKANIERAFRGIAANAGPFARNLNMLNCS
jgi:hypothetical protein